MLSAFLYHLLFPGVFVFPCVLYRRLHYIVSPVHFYSVLFNQVITEYNKSVGVRKPCQEACRVLMPDIFISKGYLSL